uniref:Uncharacterized protein n=1 Tax=Arundo donax TaxID=35708 RepID=A0A0A9DLL4_ARUDO
MKILNMGTLLFGFSTETFQPCGD